MLLFTRLAAGRRLREPRASRAADRRRRHGLHLRARVRHRDARRRGRTRPASPRRWSTPHNRSAARSAPRCSARSSPAPPPRYVASHAALTGTRRRRVDPRIHDRIRLVGRNLRAGPAALAAGPTLENGCAGTGAAERDRRGRGERPSGYRLAERQPGGCFGDGDPRDRAVLSLRRRQDQDYRPRPSPHGGRARWRRRIAGDGWQRAGRRRRLAALAVPVLVAKSLCTRRQLSARQGQPTGRSRSSTIPRW